LAFVLVVFGIGSFVGTAKITTADNAIGDSGAADRVLAQPVEPVPGELVLDRSLAHELRTRRPRRGRESPGALEPLRIAVGAQSEQTRKPFSTIRKGRLGRDRLGRRERGLRGEPLRGRLEPAGADRLNADHGVDLCVPNRRARRTRTALQREVTTQVVAPLGDAQPPMREPCCELLGRDLSSRS